MHVGLCDGIFIVLANAADCDDAAYSGLSRIKSKAVRMVKGCAHQFSGSEEKKVPALS